MAARVSIGPTLSEPYRLLKYTEASERSLMDGGMTTINYSPLCLLLYLIQAPLPYLNYPRKLVAE